MLPRFALLLTASFAIAGSAAAADDPTRRQFDPNPARPALSLDGGFTTETAGAAERGTLRFTSLFDVSDGLLVLDQGGQRQDLLSSRGVLHLLGGWSLGWMELSANLPVALWQKSDFSLLTSQGVSGPLVADVASTTLGDLRLGAKLPLLDANRWPVGVAAMVDLRLPTGNDQAFMSDGLSAVPSVVVTRRFGRLRLDGQAGYAIRGQGQYAQLVVHDGFVYALGGTVDLPKVKLLNQWKAIAELNGGLPRGENLASDRYRAPLSARAGLRAFLTPRVSLETGAGFGLGPAGYGHERWSAFFGVSWSIPSAAAHAAFVGPLLDRDGDGVLDEDDLCPEQPGAPELDGCPDDDGDGIPNREDKCPNQPGPAENDGCPLEANEALVEFGASRILLNDSIHFDTGKDTIRSESFPLLDQVVKILDQHHELQRIRVEGHTDNVGNAAYNKELSARRAASVVRYLIGKGIAQPRLIPAGYGFEQPIVSNATALGRAKNRRVVFTVLEESP
ncbi:MAG TPA: OmpA family protein [Myxococcales bacterium]|nr:OmpA family protein [Myxococcales bacterium]